MAFGLPIKIEYKVGDTRKGRGPDGPWEKVMKVAYGHIKKTEGLDGEELDVYVGPDTESEKVFAVTQMKYPDFKSIDEQKFMLGFADAKSAKAAYLENYPDPKIFGGMKEMTLEDFKKKAGDPEAVGKKIARYVELNMALLGTGEKMAAIHVMGGGQGQALLAQLASERGVTPAFVQDLGGGPAPGLHAPTERSFPRAPVVVHSRNGSGQSFKLASDDRTARIADRIDDVGIATLAAPYVAKGLSKFQGRAGILGKVGAGAARAADVMHRHEVPMELAGLAMVAPGVVHPAARAVGKVVPPRKPLEPEKVAQLEKLANTILPEFEYMTQGEKTAILSSLAGMAGRIAGGATAAKVGLQNVAQAVKHKATTGIAGASARRQFSFQQGKALGQGLGVTDARRHALDATKGIRAQASAKAPAKIQTPLANKPPTSAGAGVKPPPTAMGSGGVKTTATTVAPAAAPMPKPIAPAAKTPAAKPMISGKNMLQAGAAAGLGLATYAGYRGINAVGNLASGHPHVEPAPMANFSPYG